MEINLFSFIYHHWFNYVIANPEQITDINNVEALINSACCA
jgi:hypothetical protein